MKSCRRRGAEHVLSRQAEHLRQQEQDQGPRGGRFRGHGQAITFQSHSSPEIFILDFTGVYKIYLKLENVCNMLTDEGQNNQ